MVLINTDLRDDRQAELKRLSAIKPSDRRLQLIVREPIDPELYRFPLDNDIEVLINIWATSKDPISLKLLNYFSNIIDLDLQNAWAITDADSMSALTRAKKIVLGSVVKGSIPLAPLASLTALEDLEILLAPKDITPLQGLKSLQALSLNRGKVESLEVIPTLKALAVLDLFSLPIESLSGLGNSGIKALNLAKLSKLSDVSQLSSLFQLEALAINSCTLKKLPSLPHLKELSLGAIKDFEDASELNNSPHLFRIHVSGKNIIAVVEKALKAGSHKFKRQDRGSTSTTFTFGTLKNI